MATEHYCPEGPESQDKWAAGSSDACPYHGSKLTPLLQVRMSGRDRRKADSAAGVVGQDRGGYIHSE